MDTANKLSFQTTDYELKHRGIEFGNVQMQTLKLIGEDGL